ncbi:MAG: TonB-dependent receptor plug domain-containing protein, partial [Gemmatimonadales bacterium]
MQVSRRSNRLAAAALLFGVVPAAAFGQQPITVSGQVTSGVNSSPVPQAQVSIAELKVGGPTGADGRYSFTVPSASVQGQSVNVTVRRIGYTSNSIAVKLTGNAVVADFQIVPIAAELTATVITGLGIQREKSRVGTAQQQVTSDELNQTKSLNLIEQLSGKVSGVTITGSGTQGGSTNIIIRGANSITGDNQPMFVVDGVPISNRGRGGDPNGGYDYGSAISDLNPDDIASMSILKGPNAAALYGSRAANGVIVITTKKGPSVGGRIRTEISSTLSWDKPSILPSYQNLYGQGAQGEFQFVDGKGGGVNDFADQSYGPKLDGRLIDQFTGPQQPWVAHPGNVESFFNTGRTLSNTIAFSGGSDKVTARISLGRDQVTGYIPNNTFSKTSGLLNGSVKVSSKLTTDATLSYTHNTALNRPGVGYNNGILEQFVWFGRQVDMQALREYSKGGATNGGPSNREFNWNYNFHNNPFWMMYENPLQDTRDRILGSVSATYQLVPGISATARTGADIFRFNVDQRFAPQNIQGNAIDPNFFGGFTFLNDYSRQVTSDVSITGSRDLSSNFSSSSATATHISTRNAFSFPKSTTSLATTARSTTQKSSDASANKPRALSNLWNGS